MTWVCDPRYETNFFLLRKEVVKRDVLKVLTITLLCSSFCFEGAVGAFRGTAHLVDAKEEFDYITVHLIFRVLKILNICL